MTRLSVIAVLILLPALGCNQGDPTTPTNEAASVETTPAAFNVEGKPTVEYDVPGLDCEHCSAAACSLLEEMPGVVDVRADSEAKRATVAIDQAQFDSEAVRAALADKFGEATLADQADDAAEPAASDEASTDGEEQPAADAADAS